MRTTAPRGSSRLGGCDLPSGHFACLACLSRLSPNLAQNAATSDETARSSGLVRESALFISRCIPPLDSLEIAQTNNIGSSAEGKGLSSTTIACFPHGTHTLSLSLCLSPSLYPSQLARSPASRTPCLLTYLGIRHNQNCS